MKIQNHMTVVLAVVLAALNAVAANFPVGTHLVKGTLKDWQNNVLTSSAAVTIQAVATNGTVLASTPVDNPSADGYNFVLQIPLSTTATDSTAAVGDQLNCVLIQETGLALAASPITVGNANAVSSLIAAMLEDEGIEGEDYDPFADYDHDGVSNYNEYRAGTDPFNPDDKLEVKAYTASQSAPHAISFEYVGGHIYGVETTLSLTNPQWALQKVKKTETDSEHEQIMPSDDEEDVGLATIYVVPAEGATSQFFKLEAK